MSVIKYFTFIIITTFLFSCSGKQPGLKQIFQNPPESAKPWTFWYWRKAAVSKEGITRDLIAMKEIGLAGANLIPLQGAENPPLYEPVAEQLSPYWFELIKHAMKIADSLGLKIAMHSCDGFAVAGGPWITPELSMQKVVWIDTIINGKQQFSGKLPKPENYKGYYEDIAVYAYPLKDGFINSTRTNIPKITTNVEGIDPNFLVIPNNSTRIKSDEPCWILYEFETPFTCRTIKIHTPGFNLQSHRLIIEVSNDGKEFRKIERLESPRHGWQDTDAGITHSIKPVTAKYYKFIFNKEGTEPGSEDYDAAKWKQSLKIAGLELFEKPLIHQYEGKSGLVWRVSKNTTQNQISDSLCVPLNEIYNITEFFDTNGVLTWEVPDGNWVVLRMGHTSTGHTNYIGGAALGLECDKLNPTAVELQFNNWFGRIYDEIGEDLAFRVLKGFHVDSWEAGSQNWSPVFQDEFLYRRGYDIIEFLPVLTGLPVENVDISERFLHDIRETIAEVMVDNFYGTMANLARDKGCEFSAECVSPTFVSDGMLHYKKVDIPMGEFWYNSPTHDKPNDILDAISGAHIYGKNIIQSEAFTTLRMEWDEHPGMLKPLGDRNLALGINRLVFHVFMQNPWIDRKPGMTLGGTGLFFQPDQIWWNQSKAWIEYYTRCQALLQQGKPVVDIAVFTGEETPRRALTPDRLIPFLPGLFNEDLKEKEKIRLENIDVPYQEKPIKVTNTKNTFDPSCWVDALQGYHYDSFNKDALLHYTTVDNKEIVVPGGVRYKVLVIPGERRMSPNSGAMSVEVFDKIIDLIKQGATVIFTELPQKSAGLNMHKLHDEKIIRLINEIEKAKIHETGNAETGIIQYRKIGKGRLIEGVYSFKTLGLLGFDRDLYATNESGNLENNIAWNHRRGAGFDIYFISNQLNTERFIKLNFNIKRKQPYIYNPVSGEVSNLNQWELNDNRTEIPVKLDPNGSLFIVFENSTKIKEKNSGINWIEYKEIMNIDGEWKVSFNPDFGGNTEPIEFRHLSDWTNNSNFNIKHYSGTAVYSTQIVLDSSDIMKNTIYINLGEVYNIAEVRVNNINCGITWTPPFIINISDAIKHGQNNIDIEVSNTWRNRLIGDYIIPENERITWSTAPDFYKDLPLLKSGLIGPVVIMKE